jgi:hypothetical protein
MRGWGPALASVSVRRLDAARLAEVGLRDPSLARCVVSLAWEFRRDPKNGCSGGTVVPGRPGYCVDRSETYNCVINSSGAYACPANAETLRTPLRNENATIDARGVLRLETPLEGTHATPPLAWQRRYPHVDGFIEPWTRSGRLRPGLSFSLSRHGPCGAGSEEVSDASAFRCRSSPVPEIFDPCFPSRRDWRSGDVAACTNRPGEKTFTRWTITGRL